MSDVEMNQPAYGEPSSTGAATPAPTIPQRPEPKHGTRVKVSVHRLDGGLEDGESDARILTAEGFPIFTPPDSDRARWIPARDIKYVVLGTVDDPNLEVDLPAADTLAFSGAVRTHLDRFLAEDGIELSAPEKTTLADIILRAAVGYGPLDGLLHDRSVSEIMVNGPDQVFIERRGVLAKAEVRFEDENQLLETIRRMVATTGRHIDGLNPMVDARLPDGSRVNAIIRPAAIHGAALTIRKFKDAVLGMDDLTREGSLSPAMAEFLKAAVLGRMNVLVSGGTGSGKTTTLNVIARFIPHNQRVITIEDAAELQIA